MKQNKEIKSTLKNKVYVTFQFGGNKLLDIQPEKYAILCENKNKAREIASVVYSYDGVNYLRISKRPRLKERSVSYYNGCDAEEFVSKLL